MNHSIGHKARTYIRWWLWSGACLVTVMVIIGGVTRLTGSGLSMSDWDLIMGALPPMNEADWAAAFEQYKQFPQYQQVNAGMSLAEFKGIFFWEYLHRLVGRLIGIVFLVPFLIFWIRGYFTPKLFKRSMLLFGLGALQGAMGWIMVKSGLVDVPYVSHYRLATHLILAFILIGCCVWFALDLRKPKSPKRINNISGVKKWSIAVGALLFIQIVWGAFTAGLHAGYMYNTFPLMNGAWIPQNAWALQPLLINFVENPGTVQWVHRILGTALGLMVVWLWIKTQRYEVSHSLQMNAHLLLGIVLLQYGLGILTVLYQVPIVLGVMHQGIAILLGVSWLLFHHGLGKQKLNCI